MQSLLSALSFAFSGLRLRLFLLLLLACAPLLALTLHTAWEERRRQKSNWEQRSLHFTEVSSREEEKVVRQTRQLLLALVQSPPISSGNPTSCVQLINRVFENDRRYASVAVVHTNGEILAMLPPTLAPLNPSDQRFVQRVIESRDFVVGDFPVNRTGNASVLNFGFPVFDHAGTLQSVVVAALDLEWLSRGTELAAQLPAAATWTEIAQDGTIIVRYPRPERWLGRALPFAFVQKLRQNPRGIVERQDDDGVLRLYAFASTPNQFGSGNVVTLLGITRQTLFAAADRALFQSLAWLALAATLAVILGWIGSAMLILRPVKALVHSSARLASGDLSARTGLPHGRDELGRLTLTFDLMAQALEQREIDRKRATHKLQILSQRLVEVQESERRHIARELHDEIGQTLTVAEMNLQAALRSPGAAPLERRLAETIQAVELVQEQVHDLSLNLRPSMLDDLGLEPALRWYTHRQANLAGIKAEFRADHFEERLDPLIETECFRITQEALTNVVRHAKARSVSVQLARNNGQLELSVRDDGIGFDVTTFREKAVRGDSLGLLSMEERASLAGGRLEFHSAAGQGTEIRAWFPLKHREPQEPAPQS